MSIPRKQCFPSIEAVAAELRELNQALAHPDGGPGEVRLQVYPNGAWAIRTGDPGYDIDHHGYWGATELDGSRVNCRDVARDLIDQCREQHALEHSDAVMAGLTESDQS